MTRKIIGGSSSRDSRDISRMSTDYGVILKPVVRGASTRTLFGKINSSKELTRDEKSYNKCCQAIHDELRGKEFSGEISVNDLFSYYLIQCEISYKYKPINYNVFDAQRTFKSIMDRNDWSTITLLAKLCSWFTIYDESGLKSNEYPELSLYSLRHQWFVDSLEMSKSDKLSNFY